MRRIIPVLVIIVLFVATVSSQDPPRPPRIFLTDSASWELEFRGRGGARPQNADVDKTFSQRCPSIRVNNRRELADFVMVLEHEGGKGWAQRDNKVAVYDGDGDLVYAGSTAVLGNAVKDACAAIVSEWRRNPRPAEALGGDIQQPQPQSLLIPDSFPTVAVDMSRTEAHAKRSSAEVAFAISDAVVEHLKGSRVAVALGKNAARYRLSLIIDRPVMKWLKVTVEAYGPSDELLWKEVAESGGGLSGAHGLRVTTERLRALLDSKLGEQNGLPVLPSTDERETVTSQPEPKEQN